MTITLFASSSIAVIPWHILNCGVRRIANCCKVQFRIQIKWDLPAMCMACRVRRGHASNWVEAAHAIDAVSFPLGVSPEHETVHIWCRSKIESHRTCRLFCFAQNPHKVIEFVTVFHSGDNECNVAIGRRCVRVCAAVCFECMTWWMNRFKSSKYLFLNLVRFVSPWFAWVAHPPQMLRSSHTYRE